MSKTKSILKKYFENFYPKEVQSLLGSWLKRKGNNPEVEETLLEIWNNIHITADESTYKDLKILKEKLGISKPAEKPGSHRRLKRITLYFSAACMMGLIAGVTIFLTSKPDTKNRENIFAQINATDINTVKATTITAGDIVTIAEDNDSIKQTKEGGIVINEKEEVNFNEISAELVHVIVPRGKRSQVQFNDGTMAWLNSGTKLIYPKNFDDRKREIYIDGELYLEVAEDSKRPFIVNTQNMNVKVLGTRFNIRSYVQESEQSVVLVEGKVEVESRDKKSKETLKPSEAIFYRGNSIVKKEVDVNSFICWKEGGLRLDGGESLRTIFDRLSNHYNIHIDYTGKNENRKYKGNLILGNSVEDVLSAIAVKAEFIFDIKNDTIHIMKN